MAELPIRSTLKVSQLLVDVQNPRLTEVKENQRDTIRAMVEAQKDRIVTLAEHLLENGPNPAVMPVVTPSDDDEDMYWVLDGNRRVTALKLLETPTLADGLLDSRSRRKLSNLAIRYAQNPINELICVIVQSRNDADVWIELLHRGQNQGAGLVEWDGQVAARYDARKGNKSFALQVLDFIKDQGNLSAATQQRIESGNFPVTNLDRLLNTPYVRNKLGIDKRDGNIETLYPAEEVSKGLTRVVEDIGSGNITVSDIKKQDQRIDYINRLDQKALPDLAAKGDSFSLLEEAPSKKAIEKTTQPATRSPGFSQNRSTLIPKSCNLKIPDQRINKIFGELKRLRVDEFPNSAAVLLRVFIELSLDHHIFHHSNWSEEQRDNSKLAQKLKHVSNFLNQKSLVTSEQLALLDKIAGGQTNFAASIKSMHGYVHNRFFTAVASELKVIWDSIQFFVEAIWQFHNESKP